jgi:tRNA A58 N-methylase Trm61
VNKASNACSVLARVMQPVTDALLDRVGVAKGMSCLDVGCGGGQVTCELVRRVGPEGKALGLDIDGTKLGLAQREALQLNLGNITIENIADVVLEEKLASREEVDYLVRQLYEIADAPCTIAGLPRIVQAWGYRPL